MQGLLVVAAVLLSRGSNEAVVTKCDGTPQQQVKYDSYSRLSTTSAASTSETTAAAAAAKAMCLAATCVNGPPPNGCYPLKFVPCSTPPPASQVWKYNQSSFTFTNVQQQQQQQQELCLDLSSAGEGTNVGVYRCDGSAGQTWTVEGGRGAAEDKAAATYAVKTKSFPNKGPRCLEDGSPAPPTGTSSFLLFQQLSPALLR